MGVGAEGIIKELHAGELQEKGDIVVTMQSLAKAVEMMDEQEAEGD